MNKKLRKLVYLLLVVCLISVTFYTFSSVAVAQEKTKISVCRTGYPAVDPEFFGKILPIFEKENPQISVEVIHMSWPEYLQRMTIMVATKTEPDIYLPNTSRIPEYAEAGTILPIDEIIPEDSELYAEYPESLWNVGRWKEKRYNVPAAPGSHILFYNKGVFREAGLDPTRGPVDWSEFLVDAVKITDNTDAYGFAMHAKAFVDIQTQAAIIYFSQTGQPWTQEDEPLMNTPEGVHALEFYVNLYRKYHVTQPEPIEYTRGDCRALLRDGHVGMHNDGPWILPMLMEVYDFSSKETCEIGMDITPAGAYGSISEGGCDGWVISANSKYPDAAAKFLRFLARPEIQYEHGTIYGLPPVTVTQAEMPEFKKWYLKPLIEGIAKSWNRLASTHYHEIAEVMMEEVIQKAVLGIITPSEAMAEMERRVKEIAVGE